jgi:hypothetical protein
MINLEAYERYAVIPWIIKKVKYRANKKRKVQVKLHTLIGRFAANT